MSALLLQAGGVMLGAFFGGMARFGFARVLPGPPGTFCANLVACFVLGLASHGLASSPLLLAVLGAGLAGGMSTWSTLAKELGLMVQQKRRWPALRYAGLTCACGFIAAWRGAWVASLLLA